MVRHRNRARLVVAGVGAACWCLVGLTIALSPSTEGPIAFEGLVLFVSVGACWFWLNTRIGVDINSDQIVIRVLRTRRIPWAGVTSVQVEGEPNVEGPGHVAVPVLVLTSGKRVKVRPMAYSDTARGREHLEEAVELIISAWQNGR